MKVTIEHVLPHAPERVYAVLADPGRRGEWQENTSDVQVLTPPPHGAGARWRETQKGIGQVEAECLSAEPGARWREAGTAKGGDARVDVTLAPDGEGGTRVTMDVEITLRGLKRAFEGALPPMVRAQVPKDLDRLGALLDDEGPS